MRISITTPDKVLFEGEITSAQFPGTDGSFGVLKNRAPIISTLKSGKIKFFEIDKTEETIVEIKGGVVEMVDNRIVVLAE